MAETGEGTGWGSGCSILRFGLLVCVTGGAAAGLWGCGGDTDRDRASVEASGGAAGGEGIPSAAGGPSFATGGSESAGGQASGGSAGQGGDSSGGSDSGGSNAGGSDSGGSGPGGGQAGIGAAVGQGGDGGGGGPGALAGAAGDAGAGGQIAASGAAGAAGEPGSAGSAGAAGAPALNPCDEPPAALPTDDALFAALTAQSWRQTTCDDPGPLPPSCTTLELRPDGTYSWFTVSDYIERDEVGTWNFLSRDDHSGLLLLSNGSAERFDLSNGELTLGPNMRLLPDAALGSGGTRDGLPVISFPPLFCELLDGPWIKTNEAGLYRVPDRYEFRADGTVNASFRDGECEESWLWWLSLNQLSVRAESNTCQTNGSSMLPITFIHAVRLEDDLLLLGMSGSYLRRTDLSPAQLFIYDGYGDSVELWAEVADPLILGTEVTLSLTMTNVSTREKRVQSFTLTNQPFEPSADGNGFTAVGDETVLSDVDLTGITLPIGEAHTPQVAITPTVSGPYVNLRFTLVFEDDSQGYTSTRSFILPVAASG